MKRDSQIVVRTKHIGGNGRGEVRAILIFVRAGYISGVISPKMKDRSY